MKTQTQHTPTPWRQINGAIFDTIPWNKDQTRHTVPALFIPSPQQQSTEQNIANAAFVVRACNEYEKNQKTIEALIDCMTRVANSVRLVSGVNTFPLKLSKGFEAIAEELEKAIAQSEGK